MVTGGVFGTIEEVNKQAKDAQLINDLRSECQGYLIEIAKKDAEIARLHAHIEELRMQVVSNQGMGALLRQVYNAVDDSIMNTINTRGAIQQKRIKKHPAMNISDGDLENTFEEIRMYDIKEFFSYKPRPQSSHLKPHYRLIAKTYRTARDTLRAGAGKTRHSLRRLKK